jgi:hypothetical protein
MVRIEAAPEVSEGTKKSQHFAIPSSATQPHSNPVWESSAGIWLSGSFLTWSISDSESLDQKLTWPLAFAL